jgi:hypothetical protein
MKSIGTRVRGLPITDAQQLALDQAEWFTTSQFAAIRNHLLGQPYISEATVRRWARERNPELGNVDVVAMPRYLYLINARQWLEAFSTRLHETCTMVDGVLAYRREHEE